MPHSDNFSGTFIVNILLTLSPGEGVCPPTPCHRTGFNHPIGSGFQPLGQTCVLTAPGRAEEVTILPTASQEQVLRARQVSAIVPPLTP